MNTASLNVICRTEKWHSVNEHILFSCFCAGIEVLTSEASEYWKDLRCTQAFFYLVSENGEWKTLFDTIFGSENNTVFGNALTCGGNPILYENEVFGDLCPNDSDQMYEYFTDTLRHCGLFLLALDDEEIGWHLFEEFDGDCVSFLDENTLKLLCAAGKITSETADAALLLSRKLRALEKADLWNPSAVRTSGRWREILALSDEIKKNLPV